MFKRLLLIGVLCFAMMALVGTTAHAYPSAATGGWGVWPWNSLNVWSDWKKVANSEKDSTLIRATLIATIVEAHYLNPGDQGGGISHNFYVEVEFTGEDIPENEWISRNGQYHSEIIFEEEDYEPIILAALAAACDPDLPNDKWYLDLESPITILEMYILIEGFSELDDDGLVDDETAHIAGTCTLNFDRTEYICVTEESWGWKKKDQVNPYH